MLSGHGDETAFILAGPPAFDAALGGGSLLDACSRISRKELLAASASARAGAPPVEDETEAALLDLVSLQESGAPQS